MRPYFLALAFVCSGCDYYSVLSTQVGEHVVYHWDADTWAAENQQLCGGTAKAADRFVAGISAYYGWTLPQDGPTIEYFWDRALTKSQCSPLDASACVRTGLAPVVFSYSPFDTHELAHTVESGHHHSRFINEGFAARWQSGLGGGEDTLRTTETFLSEDQLRAQFYADRADVLYESAFTWWFALETTYGPAKMADFIAELDGPAPADHIEPALQRVFGISVAESVALAESLAGLAIEDPACEFAGLPTLVWHEDEPFVVDHEDARCEDSDVMSVQGPRASWLVTLEFPVPVELDVRVTAPQGDLTQKQLLMAKCDIAVSLDWPSYDTLTAKPPDAPTISRHLDGRYVASLIGVVTADGSVEFPRAVFEKPQSQP